MDKWIKSKPLEPNDIIVIVIAILGLSFIWSELGSIKDQNKLTEQAITESYKPIGLVNFENDTLLYNYFTTPDSTEISFESDMSLTNKGRGILFFVGVFLITAYEEINTEENNFIQYIITNNLELDFDHVPPINRLNDLAP